MWPSSWECLSPDTCVRCANVTDDTCLFNKFTCSCNYKDGDNTTCVHQEIIDIHKSKINASQSNINISLPGTSGISTLNPKSKRRTKRKKKEKYKKEHIEPDYSEACISETTNLISPDNFSSPEVGDVNEPKFSLPNVSKDKCHSDYHNKRATDESSSDSSNSSSCSSSSSSSTSSSSSSSSNDSSSSNSSSCDESKVTKCTYKGYEIMKVNEDCDNSDCEPDDSESNSSSSESADSTSASSDNSWWQEYKQLKEIQFFKKPNPDAMKDSGYVSTTSPNDSNIVDE